MQLQPIAAGDAMTNVSDPRFAVGTCAQVASVLWLAVGRALCLNAVELTVACWPPARVVADPGAWAPQIQKGIEPTTAYPFAWSAHASAR